MKTRSIACAGLAAAALLADATTAFQSLSLPTSRHASPLQSTRTPEEQAIALQKATKAMTAFTNKYLENTCTKLCSDKSVPAVVIKGLAEHKVTLGAPLCPCRFYDDKEAEAKDGYWYVFTSVYKACNLATIGDILYDRHPYAVAHSHIYAMLSFATIVRNCPCVPMRERHECHCMLFLTEDNDFAGQETKITYDEVTELSSGMSM